MSYSQEILTRRVGSQTRHELRSQNCCEFSSVLVEHNVVCVFFCTLGCFSAGSLAKCWFITQAIEMLNQALGQKTDREISFGPSPNSRTTVRFFPCVFCRLRVSHFVVNCWPPILLGYSQSPILPLPANAAPEMFSIHPIY